MTIDELINKFGYTRRTLHSDEQGKLFDSNLGLVKAATDGPGFYVLGAKVGGFIPARNVETGLVFSIYDTHIEGDTFAYDGTGGWREAEKERLGLTDIELEIKIDLDRLLVPEFDDNEGVQ